MRSDNTTLEEELLLYAVTDRSWLGDQTLYEQVELALKGGATFLQLREKNRISPGGESHSGAVQGI